MECSFEKYKRDPMSLIEEFWPDADVTHITYTPGLKARHRHYWRRANSGHDGTLAFTVEMLQELLLPLVNSHSFYKPADSMKREHRIYEIGDIWHATVFGQIKLKCGTTSPGQRERVRIPVVYG